MVLIKTVTETPIRLTGGDTSNQGRVQIYNQEERRWEAACSTSWDINDSNVVCRQLGYLFAVQLIAGGKGALILLSYGIMLFS